MHFEDILLQDKCYKNIEDELLEFAVTIFKTQSKNVFVNTRTERHGKILLIRQRGNCMRKGRL